MCTAWARLIGRVNGSADIPWECAVSGISLPQSRERERRTATDHFNIGSDELKATSSFVFLVAVNRKAPAS